MTMVVRQTDPVYVEKASEERLAAIQIVQELVGRIRRLEHNLNDEIISSRERIFNLEKRLLKKSKAAEELSEKLLETAKRLKQTEEKLVEGDQKYDQIKRLYEGEQANAENLRKQLETAQGEVIQLKQKIEEDAAPFGLNIQQMAAQVKRSKKEYYASFWRMLGLRDC